MAADLSRKQIEVAQWAVKLAGELDDLYNDIEAFIAEHGQSGTFTDDLLAGSEATKHLEASDLTTLVSGFSGALAWLDAAGEFRRDIFLKARRGGV